MTETCLGYNLHLIPSGDLRYYVKVSDGFGNSVHETNCYNSPEQALRAARSWIAMDA